MITYDKLTDSIISRRRKIRKSSYTAGNEYLISLKKKGKKMSFHFHDGQPNEGKLRDWLMCLTLDYNDYIYTRGISDQEFRREFGYSPDTTSDERIKSIRSILKENSKRYKAFFTKAEIKVLQKEVIDY